LNPVLYFHFAQNQKREQKARKYILKIITIWPWAASTSHPSDEINLLSKMLSHLWPVL
jgi:hypothetical protein